MRRSRSGAVLAAALVLFATIANAAPHEAGGDFEPKVVVSADEQGNSLSYFAYGESSGIIIAHIALMVVAWCLLLPVAVVLSVARSRYSLPSQFVFLTLNAVGLLFGMIYNDRTPDLYENNVHHKIGWIITWVVSSHVIVSLLLAFAGRGRSDSHQAPYECAPFLPVAEDETTEPRHPSPPNAGYDYRWSGDSDQGTERNCSSLRSCPASPTDDLCEGYDGFERLEGNIHSSETVAPFLWPGMAVVHRFLAKRVPGVLSSRALKALNFNYNVMDRIILPFGFVALSTGAVTYGGIMRGEEIFGGLAHFIKGGIFFWYGVITLGRWMGCWADLGWAWNLKPPKTLVGWKARVRNGEFTESAVIFSYGVTNVFLEHLAGWGGAWTTSDLEHVSVAFLFFGGGLCGMLFESTRVREWVNNTVLRPPVRAEKQGRPDAAWELPNAQSVSLNPMPALVILLLGLMMSSHHQSTMTSSMIHKQWGDLLVGFALSRGVTYLLLYLKPPTSYLPARPPTEIIASFCLMSGGLMFMLSTSTIVDAMEYYELDSMFTFTVVMGVTSLAMAWEILTIAVKAWAVKKEMQFSKVVFRPSTFGQLRFAAA